MARSFKEFEGVKRRRSPLCPRCQKEPKAGAVNIRLNEFEDGQPNRYRQAASRQISLCENCSVEMFDELVEHLDREANGGTRPARHSRAGKASEAPSSARSRRRKRQRAAA